VDGKQAICLVTPQKIKPEITERRTTVIIRDNHVVLEPNEIEFHDPGDHDDGVGKKIENYLKLLEASKKFLNNVEFSKTLAK